MKIGVLTVYSVSNFGSFLQAYALKQYLESMGHEVYHIKIYSDQEVRKRFYKYPVTRRSLKYPLEEFNKYRFGKIKYQKFQADLVMLQERERDDISDFDLVMIGSDELWNISEEEFRNPLYFGSGIDHAVTYGISTGRAKMEDFEQYPEFQELIRKIEYITVRDVQSEKLIKSITGKKAPMVCDPTFLIPAANMYRECQDPFLDKNRYILLYTYYFTYPDWLKHYLIRYAREHHLKLVSAGFYFSWCDHCVNCSPMEFSDVIRKSVCLVTTTFHGSVFAVLNHKKMVAVPFSPKVNDLLNKTGLSEMILDGQVSYKKFCSKMNLPEADYCKTDRKISRMKADSEAILNDILVQFQ